MVRSVRGFCFTGLGHVNMRKAKDGGLYSSPLTAAMHLSFFAHSNPTAQTLLQTGCCQLHRLRQTH